MLLTDEQYIAPLKRKRVLTLAWKGHYLALERECLPVDTRDTAIQSKWWDSAHEALEDWRNSRNEQC